MVFPLVRLSVPLVCLLRSDPYMHSFGVNSGVYKQRCWSLSPPLSAFSLVFSIPGSPFFGALARNLGLWLPPFDTLPTTLPLSRPKQQEYWHRKKKKKKKQWVFSPSLSGSQHSKSKGKFPSVLGAFSTSCHHNHSGLPRGRMWAKRRKKRRRSRGFLSLSLPFLPLS